MYIINIEFYAIKRISITFSWSSPLVVVFVTPSQPSSGHPESGHEGNNLVSALITECLLQMQRILTRILSLSRAPVRQVSLVLS